MLPSSPHPKWWQLYLTFPLLIGLFLMDHKLRISAREHEVVQIGIILLIFGLVYLWIRANSTALSHLDRKKHLDRILIVQVPPLQLPGSNNGKHPILRLPDSEVKGMLSTTFEMDCIDVEALPMEESSQETNKD